MQVLCLDVGAANIKYGRMDESAVFLARGEIPTRAREGAEKVFLRLVELIRHHEAAIDCISICTKGKIDPLTGCIRFATEDIPGWSGFPLGDRLRQAFRLPIFIHNDAHAMALGEAHYGSMRNVPRFLCMNYGFGVGGALVVDGHVHALSGGREPDMGHMITHPDGRRCACGRQGCYEAYASVHALTRLAASKMRLRSITGRELFALLEKGDAVALSCLDQWVREVTLGLSNILYVLSPEHLVLGGGIMERPMVVQRIRESLRDWMLPDMMPDEIRAAQLGNAAGLYGCFVIACQNLGNGLGFPE